MLHPHTFAFSETSYSLLRIHLCSNRGYAFLPHLCDLVEENTFKVIFHKYEMKRKCLFPIFCYFLLTNNKARIYLCFSSGDFTDLCGLASLKSMYTVTGSGRHGNLMSILRELCEDSKATSLSIENTVLACSLPYPDKKSCRVWIVMKTGLWKKLCAWLLYRFKLCFCLLSTTFQSWTPRFSFPRGIQITGSMRRDI